MIRKTVLFLVLFLVILAYFVIANGWYTSANLVIKGKAGLESSFILQWDSGAGFNQYEEQRFFFTSQSNHEDQAVGVSLRYTGKRGPASLKKDIYCSRITVDGKDLDLSRFKSAQGGYNPYYGIRLDKNFRQVSLSAQPKSVIEVDLKTDVRSGIVEISVGPRTETIDLYMANTEAKKKTFYYWTIDEEGLFEVYLNVPRYQIERFRLKPQKNGTAIAFDSVVLIDSFSDANIPLNLEKKSNQYFSDFSEVRNKKYFNPIQFFQQALFALFSTWLIWCLFTFIKQKGGVTKLCSGKRKIFWLFLGGAVVCYSFWFIAFWPGIMSVDSLKIWRAAILPEVFLNDHPLINVLLYRYLSQIWTNPAIVPLFHISLMGLLIASIFYSLHRKGLSLKCLLPFYLLLILSIPIGLYNTVLWKDIPFAILIVFWAYTLADLYGKKLDGHYKLSGAQITWLIMLMVALAFLRHNGLVYLVIIPVYIVVLGLVDTPKVLKFSLVGFLVISVGFIALLNSPVVDDSNYILVRVSNSLKSLFNTPFSDLLRRTFIDYWGILDVNQTDSKWDLWHRFLGDRQAYRFLNHTGWNDVYPYVTSSSPFLTKMRELCMQLYWWSYQKPWVYLSWNPIYILLLMPVTIVLGKRYPLSAIFSSFLLIQVFVLVSLVNIMNWRYYYFVCLGGMFIGPLLLLDIKRKRTIG